MTLKQYAEMKKEKLHELHDIITEDICMNGIQAARDINSKYRWLYGNHYELVENVPYEKYLEMYIDIVRECAQEEE